MTRILATAAGTILLVAGASKLAKPRELALILTELAGFATIHRTLAWSFGAILMVTEWSLGIALLSIGSSRAVVVVTGALFAAFAVVGAFSLTPNRHWYQCRCLGPLTLTHGPSVVVANAAIACTFLAWSVARWGMPQDHLMLLHLYGIALGLAYWLGVYASHVDGLVNRALKDPPHADVTIEERVA